jgi:hypothetical protein
MIKDKYSEIPSRTKRWKLRHIEQFRAIRRAYYAKHLAHPRPQLTPEERKRRDYESKKRWKLKHPERFARLALRRMAYPQTPYEKRMARTKLRNAIAMGKFARPKHCSKCGREGQVQAHHHDYSKPFEVIWLCPCCHIDIHKSEFLT